MDSALRILAVDDEPSITRSMHYIFSRPHYEVTSAQDGLAALAHLETGAAPFDVIITDNNMPELSGVDFVRELRKRNFAGKIMVLSAHLSAELRVAYQELGVQQLLDKPFDIHQLRRALESAAA